MGRPPPVARRTRFVLLDYYDANQSVASREAAVFSFSLIRIYVTGGVEKPEGSKTQDNSPRMKRHMLLSRAASFVRDSRAKTVTPRCIRLRRLHRVFPSWEIAKYLLSYTMKFRYERTLLFGNFIRICEKYVCSYIYSSCNLANFTFNIAFKPIQIDTEISFLYI